MPDDNPSIEDLLQQPNNNSIQTPNQANKDNESDQLELDEKLHNIEHVGIESEIETKAATTGLEYVDFKDTPIDREALVLLSKEEMETLKAAVFLSDVGQLRMATTNPTGDVTNKMQELAKQLHANAKLYLISEDSFKKALEEYELIPKKPKIRQAVSITAKDLEKFQDQVKDISTLTQKIHNIPLTDVMTIIISSGIQAKASDIHIEAEEKDIKLRFRLDGVLHDVATLTRDMLEHLVSRIKLLSKLKLNVSDKPQDGRITIEMPNDKLDIRVSTLPTSFGESVVMRLLRSSSVGVDFESLGLRGKAFMDLKREIERPNGMILTTGPTGSGKTTTLYSILSKLNDEETKVITLEDPIEYKLEGVNQSQVDESRDYNFVKGLRSILRQDPDVLMVGEIRDFETADVAINAALTGHLVLSTLHTNDASGALPRLVAMGVKPFLISPAINAVIGQRLVRKICQSCKKEVELDNQKMSRAMSIIESIPENSGYAVEKDKELKFFTGNMCDKCNNSGYNGRIGIYEVFAMIPEIEKRVLTGEVSESDIKDIAQKNGMVSMVQDGILKALEGITTVEEVFRVSEE